MTAFSTMVLSLKRAVATPGTFDDLFGDTTDADIVGLLEDAFAEAQLDGFFPGADYAMDLDADTVAPDLTSDQGALVIIYAACRWVQTQLLNTKNHVHYAAGGAVYDVQTSSNVLTSLLKQYQTRKEELINRFRLWGAASAFLMADQYVARAVGSNWAADYWPECGGW